VPAMVATDRDLVAALRAELASIAPARLCDRKAEIAGLAGTSQARLGPVARLSLRLVRTGGGTSGRVAVAPALRAQPAFDWDAAAEHCRLAWLRGLFLS